jgi:hypothetical protein
MAAARLLAIAVALCLAAAAAAAQPQQEASLLGAHRKQLPNRELLDAITQLGRLVRQT